MSTKRRSYQTAGVILQYPRGHCGLYKAGGHFSINKPIFLSENFSAIKPVFKRRSDERTPSDQMMNYLPSVNKPGYTQHRGNRENDLNLKIYLDTGKTQSGYLHNMIQGKNREIVHDVIFLKIDWYIKENINKINQYFYRYYVYMKFAFKVFFLSGKGCGHRGWLRPCFWWNGTQNAHIVHWNFFTKHGKFRENTKEFDFWNTVGIL